MPLTKDQQRAVEMVQREHISIITGAPGTGKTYTLKQIIAWAKEQGLLLALAAPTGKAAKQMQKATGHTASTIHRLLGPRYDPKSGGFTFEFNQTNKLPVDFLIIDEMSMVTSSLMADVMRAVDIYKTKLLLIGDHYQLPAVGMGAVLRDFLGTGLVPTVELTEIQRNAGNIVKACHLIKDGKPYKPSRELAPESGANLRHIEMSSPEIIKRTIKKIVCERLPSRGYDPVDDVQIVTATNTRTELSCDNLNIMLQQELNNNPPAEGTRFRKGDKVIYTKNEQLPTLTGDKVLVVNGDMGRVADIPSGKGQIVVDFFDPDRTVVLPKVKNKLLLAYSVTCHRMQGSEAPVVIIPVHHAFDFLANRQWIYTAISRAQEICITIGQMSAIKKAIKTDMIDTRVTLLKERIWEQSEEAMNI